MSEENKIILKIQNLLNLSKDNKNLNESTVAALKAKELMQKHNLSEVILEETYKALNKKIIDSIRDKNQSLNDGKIEEWQACLANAICNNNGCRAYLTSIEKEGKIEEAISIVGRETDVEFVFVLYSWLNLELLRLSKEYNASNSLAFQESFLLGAIKKIGIRLQEENNRINEDFRRTSKSEKNKSEYAISILDNRIKNIDLYLKNLNLKNQSKQVEDVSAFGKGYVKADSIDLMKDKKINN